MVDTESEFLSDESDIEELSSDARARLAWDDGSAPRGASAQSVGEPPVVPVPPPVTFSFICPCYNEQDGLESFHGRLTAVAEKMVESYEIIYIDDGSSDNTGEVLRRLAAADRHVRVVEFSRNFGHQLAVTAGYDYARGLAVISLDSDCQHPPELIQELAAKWREGYEVVYTIRTNTEGISPIRRAVGRLVYRAIRLISGTELTDQADFRLMDRKAVDALRQTREHARFVRGLVRWIGFRQTGVPYVAERRAAGRSNYSLKQLAGMAGAGMFNFSLRPLRLAYVLGTILLAAGVIGLAALLVLWLLGYAPAGWTALILVVLAMFGLQFILLGVLGEYVGRTFEEARARPLYVVRQTLGFQAPRQEPAAPPQPATSPRRENVSVFT